MTSVSAVPAVFVDRDGIIVEDIGYPIDPAITRFVDGSAQALLTLARYGLKLIVVTNQSGVARGLYTLQQVDNYNQWIQEQLREVGVELAGIYVCPHCKISMLL